MSATRDLIAAAQPVSAAEVPMPEPDATLHDDGYYVARHSIRSSYEFNRAGWRLDVLSMATARTYGVACRAAGEAAGYARVLEWAVSRWKDEVENRPLENKNRRPLDDVWRQVVRFAGGDPDALLGPSHDAALRGEVKP